LIDFGIAEKLCGGKEQQMDPTGSLIYMSPELFKHKTGGRHTDWWAFGVLAFELMTGRSPWSTLRDRQRLRYEIENCRVELPSAASHLSTAAHDLVAKLLDKDFRSRLGTTRTNEVKGHAFFHEIDWLAVQEGESAPAFACGRIEVDKTESEQALELYLEKGAELASNFSWDEEGLGDSRACATWIFGGVDMVASHPLVVVGGSLPAQLPVCEVHAPV
jgi:serine/threonine protein kinase